MKNGPMAGAPAQSESDVNSTPLRAAWQSDHLGERSRALLARDNRAFLHQSVSTPCLAPIVRAEGLYTEAGIIVAKNLTIQGQGAENTTGPKPSRTSPACEFSPSTTAS